MRLDTRRDRSDSIETFKVLNGNYSVNRDLFFCSLMVVGGDTPRNLFKRRCRLDIRKFVLAPECFRPYRAEALSDAFVRRLSEVGTLSDVCLTVAYTSDLTRERRGLGRLKLAQR